MMPIHRLLSLLFLLVLVLGCVSCGRDPAAPAVRTLYTCGMHPQIVQDHPGNCPVCGMKLTPVRKPADAAAPSSGIVIDPATIQTMGLRTGTVTRGPLRRTIRTVANVDYDETGLADVTTKYKGWIEKLYVDATGALVNPGDPLFSIYSPELYSAQTEYLAALAASSNSPGGYGRSLLDSARTKLRFYDISDAQIRELDTAHEPKKSLTISAPISGFVTEKMVVSGQMVEAGMKLYRLAELGIVWVYAQIYEQDLASVQLGQEAVMILSYLPDRKFRGRVTYVYPTVDDKTRTARVRMEFHNPGYFLKPGMFATVELECNLEPSVLLVPDSSVLRSGHKNTVFVALPGGRFEARTVSLGLQAQDSMDQVLAGLSEGERIVTSGQFLLDSESQLREAIDKMSGSAQTTPGQTSAAVQSLALSEGRAEQVVWVCPMPEHVSIQYDHPGKCPICAMTLVPVPKSTLAKISPGGRLLYHTCPMPDHGDVHADKPGKCPKCGMTLIPVMSAPAFATNTPGLAVPEKLPPLFACPMHLEIVSDKPGQCPRCAMELVATGSLPDGKKAVENWLKRRAPGQP